MKKLWNGAWCLIFVSFFLYAAGYFFEVPLMKWSHEIYADDYLVKTNHSVLPILIGSLCAMFVTRK